MIAGMKVNAKDRDLNGRSTTVVGVPHLSYYDITTKSDVIEWIRNKIVNYSVN